MWNLKNEINEHTKQKQTHREQSDDSQREGGLEAWLWKVKGLRNTDQWLQESRDVKYSIGNIVSIIVTTMYGNN